MENIENNFDEDAALADLLKDGVLFSNCRSYVDHHGEWVGETITLHVNINDIFALCADSIDLTLEELPVLYNLFLKYGFWGVIKWAAIKLKQQPRRKIKDEMKKIGIWDEELEGFKENKY